MEGIPQNVTNTAISQIQKTASNWLYYEIWSMEEYWWYGSLLVEIILALCFLFFSILSFSYYYNVEQHFLVQYVEKQSVPKRIVGQKKLE